MKCTAIILFGIVFKVDLNIPAVSVPSVPFFFIFNLHFSLGNNEIKTDIESSEMQFVTLNPPSEIFNLI